MKSLITGYESESDDKTLYLVVEGDVHPGTQCSAEVEEQSLSKEKLHTLCNMLVEVRDEVHKMQHDLLLEKKW
jgi:hypothetical protein